MDDAARIRAFGRALDDALAERTVATPVGDALFVDELPDVYFLNYLRADRGTPEEIVTAADAAMEHLHHRKVFTYLERDLGWQNQVHLVMQHRHEPDRLVDTGHVREVDFEQIAPFRIYDYEDVALGERLNEAQRRVCRAIDTRWLAAFDGTGVAAWCSVRSDGHIAQIEDVNTLPNFRRRNHGRAVVQKALELARATHEIVYLEALEDDWPKELYARLGFETVDRCYHHLRAPHPLTALRLRTPRLELRLATVAELRALYRVAEAGVHDPAVMPFEIPWTDQLNEADFLAYHRDTLARVRRDEWQINLITFLDGKPVGSQGITGKDFDTTRSISTGSWLGARYQGQGIGTEMRSAVLSFAFDVLGARVAHSGALADNHQSLGVSRKLGYEVTGSHLVSPRGEPVEHTDLELTPDRFRPATEVEITGVDPSWFRV